MPASHTVREIPLSKLIRSASNVRRTGPDIDIAGLAASIAAHGLLQSLSVRPLCDAKGKETGRYAVSGGGRRLAALNLLAKQKRIAKSAPIPCVINSGDEEEASLAENVMREPLHPADQFDAFQRLTKDKGMGAEDIAARFGVTPLVVRQRLRLAAVSPKLMQVYREGTLSLEQLAAFAITDDHARQEQVFDALPEWDRDARSIRHALMEEHVPLTDKRARFVGAEAYQAAGGNIVRDLFSDEDEGYCADVALLDRLTAEKLAAAASEVKAEGWKWVEAFADYPHSHGLRRIYAEPVPLPTEQQDRLNALEAERDELVAPFEGDDNLPDDVSEKYQALEAEIETFSDRQHAFDPKAIALGGVYISVGHDGTLRVDRGFVKPKDAHALASDDEESGEGAAPKKPDSPKLLSDSLVRDLTAHRTLALRLAVGNQPEIALVALVHAMAANIFYWDNDRSCFDVRLVSGSLDGFADGLADSPAAKALADRHEGWHARIPAQIGDLWPFVIALPSEERMALLAHCAALTIHVVKQPNDRRVNAFATADHLANAVSLNMAQHWSATASSYFGRVSKAQIIEAVREGVSAEAANRLSGFKKKAMAESAEKAVAGRGWLPALLRKPDAGPAE